MGDNIQMISVRDDLVVEIVYRAFCEARNGGPLTDNEHSALYSLTERAWISAALESVFK